MEPVHDEIIWLWVYRDFSGNAADVKAENVCLRLGLTAYPQHHLVHPESLVRLANTGRSERSFLAGKDVTRDFGDWISNLSWRDKWLEVLGPLETRVLPEPMSEAEKREADVACGG